MCIDDNYHQGAYHMHHLHQPQLADAAFQGDVGGGGGDLVLHHSFEQSDHLYLKHGGHRDDDGRGRRISVTGDLVRRNFFEQSDYL